MTFRQFGYRNVLRNKRTYSAYFLSSAFSVMIFFVCALFIFNPHIREGVIFSFATQAMIAAECIMYIFSFFFVLYSVSSFLKTRKHEFGILLMHGMTKSQLNRMIFLENMTIGIGAITTGISAGLLTGKLFLMAASHFLGLSSLPFYLSWQALVLTVGSFVLLYLIISVCTSIFVPTNKLIELFQAGQKPKSDPKSSILLSLFAAGLLFASYYLAATATTASVGIRMFPVIAMTIIGTYFFYTQLSIFMIRILKRNRKFFRNKTNIVTVSSLAYRLKDNARMFFMVTIISTVAFCAVGVFASTNVLWKQFHQDYPAAISYLAKDGSQIEQNHLDDIKEDLAAKGLPYKRFKMPVKYTVVASSTSKDTPEKLPLISFSDYKKAVAMAGFSFNEQPLTGNEALVMITSQLDKASIGEREKVQYTLKENRIKIREIGYTRHVALPDYLLPDVEEDYNLGGVVVSDQRFHQVRSPVKTDYYTGFYVEAFEKTTGIAHDLANNGKIEYETGKPYAITISGKLLDIQKSMYSIMLFVAWLVGTVFFIAAGSFLYFRLYADLDYDRRHYLTIGKLGLTEKELNKIVTRQLALLFFVPIGIAIVHSLFAFNALQSFFYLSIATEMQIVLISFLLAQVIYFFFIRHRYLRNLKKALI